MCMDTRFLFLLLSEPQWEWGAYSLKSLINTFFPNIHVGNKLEQPWSSLMAGGVNAGAAAGVLYAMNPGSLESLGFGKVIAAGFIADAGADYIYYNLAKPMLVGK